MNKLISLELKRNSLRTYHIAVLFITFALLGLLYLLAIIPKLDPTETDLNVLMSYSSLITINNVICMVVFTILSSVMSAKFIVEEYAGKRAVLLFSYPIGRKKILGSKILMVFSYIVVSMMICGALELGIFFLSESLFPLCAEKMSFGTIINSFLCLFIYALIAGALGIISLWFGFLKKSVSVTIIAAVITATVICQIAAFSPIPFGILVVAVIVAKIALNNLVHQVEKMEV